MDAYASFVSNGNVEQPGCKKLAVETQIEGPWQFFFLYRVSYMNVPAKVPRHTLSSRRHGHQPAVVKELSILKSLETSKKVIYLCKNKVAFI